MTPDIEIHEVTQQFGDVTALDQLSLSLDGGKIHGLLGRNGSGKSTLLSIIAAFRKPTSGYVSIGGEPVFENARVTREIALVREAGDTVEDGDKVEDALCYAEWLRPHWDAAYADELISRFGLSKRKKIGGLSRGQRSALAITLGLASRSPLTMFDESYLGLDAPSRAIFYEEILADYIRHPRTIVISTHLIEEVSSLFEEVAIIDKGKLLMQAETEQMLAHGAVVTGPAVQVDLFANGHTILGHRQLGPTKSVTLYGALTDAERERALDSGIDIGPVSLQDLFIHLTTQSGVN
jgi:ABC-2 type transport system ATP-binding protein